MRIALAALAAVALTAPGCKSANEKTCDRYVDLQIKCGEKADMTEETKDALRMFAGGMCVAALEGELGGAEGEAKKMILEMHADIKREVKCLENVKTCDQWQACQDKGDEPSGTE